jgi:hypothetical protein
MSPEALKGSLNELFLRARGIYEGQGKKVLVISKPQTLGASQVEGVRMTIETRKGNMKIRETWVICHHPIEPNTILVLDGTSDPVTAKQTESFINSLISRR